MNEETLLHAAKRTHGLVTCQSPGCIDGYNDGEKCDICWGTGLVSAGEPGSEEYEVYKTEK
ncbi:hypothetical protein PPM_p0164 (plasmid) [Paenibacillus polymyxa M1]|uniref:hypothetical protein n=1 Tax=Paenibacillus polymyxa TaxID=1406 RepID=UPI00021BBB90|nr:hypothetical protein [Paenibacillus polymyxa]CCC86314.1 hypothetical protein PPM_p0164 [Paenibacillus polymyxa M1]